MAEGFLFIARAKVRKNAPRGWQQGRENGFGKLKRALSPSISGAWRAVVPHGV